MQHLVAPVSINALHIVVPTLVGNVVPCSDPMITSSVWFMLFSLAVQMTRSSLYIYIVFSRLILF